MSAQEEEQAYQQRSTSDPLAKEFLALLAALPWLMRQYFADGIKLFETEGRLAFRSLILIAALTLCLAGLIAGAWLVLLVLGVYAAVQADAPLWGIAVAVILLHILVFAALAQQIKALARYLFFPHSRRSLARLVRQDQPPTP